MNDEVHSHPSPDFHDAKLHSSVENEDEEENSIFKSSSVSEAKIVSSTPFAASDETGAKIAAS